MLIRISNLNYSYKTHKNVINDLSMNINSGKIHAILGHNGAGKTTLFKLIAGVLRYKNGSIMINKSLIADKRKISLIPETHGVYSDLTVQENLEFRYRLSKQPVEDMSSRINLLLDVFGLANRNNEQIKFLSQGLTRRVVLSCAIIGKPKLLIMDEPTNGVDPASLEILTKVLRQLKENGTSILISSHDLNFVRNIADEITIINEGTNVYHGSNSELDEFKLKTIYFSYTKEENLVDYAAL